jgi:UDP-GlcNAc:undecaprenyl-phosphate GlcNAc-1-phosphate transferase
LRKNHDGLVPLAGGALFVAFAVAAVLLEQRPEGSNSFLLGLMLLVLLGVVDDLRDVRASIKLAAQFVCVALMVLPSQTFIWNFGTILGEQPGLPTAWAAPVTIIAAVGLVNALNMIDGVDGLAGSLSVVALFWFACLGNSRSPCWEHSASSVFWSSISVTLGESTRRSSSAIPAA